MDSLSGALPITQLVPESGLVGQVPMHAASRAETEKQFIIAKAEVLTGEAVSNAKIDPSAVGVPVDSGSTDPSAIFAQRTGSGQSAIEQPFFQYNFENNRGLAPRYAVTPAEIGSRLFRATSDLVERAQESIAESGKMFSSAGSDNPHTTTQTASKNYGPDAETSVDANSPSSNFQQLVDRYASVSWSLFGANMAISSISAAVNSVNALVKQQ